MKKLFTIVCTLVLGGALAVAQTGTGTGTTSGQYVICLESFR